MDLLTGAGAFATIVGLLSNFKSERSSGDLDQFILWLKEKRHEDVASSIENNKALLRQLNEILATNHDELVGRLSALDQIISSIAAHIQEFAGLAQVVHPQSFISDQAISILIQLVNSGAKMFMEMKVMTGRPDRYLLIDGASGDINYEEPRFIEDDLNTLVQLGLLQLDFTSRGTRRFFVTRAAVRYIQAIERTEG